MPRSARFTTTHDLLKKQALALFLEKGYQQTSIQEITERAGLAVGSFTGIFHARRRFLSRFGTNMRQRISVKR